MVLFGHTDDTCRRNRFRGRNMIKFGTSQIRLGVLVSVLLFTPTLISCGADEYQVVADQLNKAENHLEDLEGHLQDLRTECQDLVNNEDCDIFATSTTQPQFQSTSPSTAATASDVVCLQTNGVDCIWELTLPEDAGCNAQTPSSEKDFALLPCEYSYWIGYLESRLTTLGARVSKDGYYASNEIDIIKGAQRRLGVGDDGLIGTKTWRAAFSEIDCFQFNPSTGEPSSMQDCYNDTNSDGMYGPGDEVPN